MSEDLRQRVVEAMARANEQASGPPGYSVTDQLWEWYNEVTPDRVERLRRWADAMLDAALDVLADNAEAWDDAVARAPSSWDAEATVSLDFIDALRSPTSSKET